MTCGCGRGAPGREPDPGICSKMCPQSITGGSHCACIHEEKLPRPNSGEELSAPSLIEQRDQMFVAMRLEAGDALKRGDKVVAVNPADLIGVLATLEAYQEMEAEMPRRERVDRAAQT